MVTRCVDCNHEELTINNNCQCGCHVKSRQRSITVKGGNLTLYVRLNDAEVWSWAREQAETARMSLTQYITCLLEKARQNDKTKASST